MPGSNPDKFRTVIIFGFNWDAAIFLLFIIEFIKKYLNI